MGRRSNMNTAHDINRRAYPRNAITFLLGLAFVIVGRGCISRTPSASEAVYEAIKGNDIQAVTAYLNDMGDPDIVVDNTPGTWAMPLHLAAVDGRVEIARLLLDSGANPNAKCSLGKTPLYYTIFTTPKEGRLECAKLLLERGADAQLTNKAGTSILHSACMHRDATGLQIAMLLIEHGADVRMQDSFGNTPLHCLASCRAPSVRSRCLEVAKMLLDHGASIDAKNKTGQRAVDLARSSEFTTMVDLLKEE